MFGDGDGGIQHACQRCKQPLRMEESFADLAPSAYDLNMSSLSDRSGSMVYLKSHQNDPPLRNQQLTSRPNHATLHPNSNRGRVPPQPNQPPHFRANNPARLPTSSSLSTNRDSPSSQSTVSSHHPGPAESFVVLSESTLGAARAQPDLQGDHSPSPKPQDQSQASSVRHPSPNINNRVFKLAELLSGNPANFQHPLCTECTDKLLEWMHNQLQSAKSNRDRYAIFERELNREKSAAAEGSYESCKKIKQDIEELKIRESVAVQKLRQTESECEKFEAELREIERLESEQDKEEEQFWDDYNQYLLESEEIQSQLDSVTTRYRNDQNELAKLKATNVYKDAFCIGCETGVGTINGLRLGRLTDVPVEWVEINAAWGHTALLLQTLCKRMKFTLDGYRLIPMGSFSRIERTKGDKSCLELFGSDDFALARMLHNRRFDNAMVDFLECLRQVSEQVIRRNPQTKIPFRVHKDKIGEASIKLSFSSDEAWTSALRHVLFTLKIMNAALDHISN
ncbi:autophagy protein 6 [Puccinia graminis f. sp. tritici]|uniref:Autophagy protein 6 n=2 Tax=Puccinia graminis f. sp. tritici TaxID=56615 RepID=A0A5B0SGK6_PUCGR|nr:autophagy protein 6 [Puccinia graminis f. sp. tritici]KAA1136997.1 autophagy protein 6 [Puccinia graminis f. sp. tritici]